jgi:hypothetical protein
VRWVLVGERSVLRTFEGQTYLHFQCPNPRPSRHPKSRRRELHLSACVLPHSLWVEHRVISGLVWIPCWFREYWWCSSYTPYARKRASRNEPEGRREPSRNLQAVPISLLLCLVSDFMVRGTTQRPLFFTGVTHEFRLPYPRTLLQVAVLVDLPRAFFNSGRSFLELCFTCFTIPVQS